MVVYIDTSSQHSPLSMFAVSMVSNISYDSSSTALVARRDSPSYKHEFSGDVNKITSSFGWWAKVMLPVRIMKLCREEKRVRIITPSPYAAFICCGLRSKMINEGCDFKVILLYPYSRPEPVDQTYSLCLKEVDGVVVASEVQRDEITRFYQRIPREKFTVIKPAITNVFPGKEKENNLPPKISAITMLYHGAITADCGLGGLIDALGRYHNLNVSLLVAGQGQGRYAMPLVRSVRNLGLGDRVTFLGDVPLTDDIIGMTDVGVIPSPYNWTNPLTAVAFMSKRLPVIAADSRLNRDIIRDRVDGLLVDTGPGSDVSESWTATLRMLIDNTAYITSMSDEAMRRAESEMTMEGFINKFKKFL